MRLRAGAFESASLALITLCEGHDRRATEGRHLLPLANQATRCIGELSIAATARLQYDAKTTRRQLAKGVDRLSQYLRINKNMCTCMRSIEIESTQQTRQPPDGPESARAPDALAGPPDVDARRAQEITPDVDTGRIPRAAS